MTRFKKFRNHTWYRIELFIGKGGISVFYALAMLLVGTIVFLMAIRYLLQWFLPKTTQLPVPAEDVGNNFYHLFIEVTDPGNMANFVQTPAWIKFTAIMAGLSGIVIFSLLVALITTGIEKLLRKISQGTTNVYEKGHYLIIGSNSRIIDILKELVLASEKEKNTVVIISERPKEELENEIDFYIKKRNRLNIITRTGKTTSPAMLEKMSVDTAKVVVVLSSCESYSSDEEKELSDTQVIKICFALSIAINKGLKMMVIPEVYMDGNRKVVQNILNNNCLLIDSDMILSRLLVQTSLFNGLVGVYEELFSFEGSELYFVENNLHHVPFGEISYHLNDGIVIGYKCPLRGMVINPSPDEIVSKDCELLLVISDKSNYHYHHQRIFSPREFELPDAEHKPVLKSKLVLGWNSKTFDIISEYDKYISQDSSIKLVLTTECNPEMKVVEVLHRTIQSQFSIEQIEELDESFLETLDLLSYDMIVVLKTCADTENNEVVDSRNIKLLLIMKRIMDKETERKKPLVVVEVLNTSNIELFEHMGLSDFLLSNRIISIFLTQLAKQPDLIHVYNILLSKEGSEIYIKPAINYFNDFSQEFSMADLLSVGVKRHEVVIGYKKILEHQKPNGRYFDIYINPNKNKKFSLNEKDFLIVVADNN